MPVNFLPLRNVFYNLYCTSKPKLNNVRYNIHMYNIKHYLQSVFINFFSLSVTYTWISNYFTKKINICIIHTPIRGWVRLDVIYHANKYFGCSANNLDCRWWFRCFVQKATVGGNIISPPVPQFKSLNLRKRNIGHWSVEMLKNYVLFE